MTFLAFVYVPLNLATSIFGTNLQQLNESGQHVWVFVVTAVLALFLTSAVWIAIVLCRDYRQWREQLQAPSREEWVKRERQYSFVIRTAILLLIVKKGYRRWLWVSGAWIRILTNERINLGVQAKTHKSLKTHKSSWEKECLLYFQDQTACDYVCQYIHQKLDRRLFCFDPGHYLDDEERP